MFFTALTAICAGFTFVSCSKTIREISESTENLGNFTNTLVISDAVTLTLKTDSIRTDGMTPVVPAEKHAVDMGLPSGIKWAAGNLGAVEETDPGLYYMWGETMGHTKGGERELYSGNYSFLKQDSIFEDLTSVQDAVIVRLGGEWRMPTKAEFEELIDNSSQQWTSNYKYTGVAGILFTSKINGNKLFFSACGGYYNSKCCGWGKTGGYWSSDFCSSTNAWGLYFNQVAGNTIVSNGSRSCAFSVRAVMAD